MKKYTGFLIAVVLLLSGCAFTHTVTDGDDIKSELWSLDTDLINTATDAYLRFLAGSFSTLEKELNVCKKELAETVKLKPPVEPPIVEEPVEPTEPSDIIYGTRHHHTTWGSSDGGKSLVLCPGQEKLFTRCYVGMVPIPFHGTDNGRYIWWNMSLKPAGDIICVGKDGKKYGFKSDQKVQRGNCN